MRLALAAILVLLTAAPAGALTVSSGALTATVSQHPWQVGFTQRGGHGIHEAPSQGLAFHTTAGWMHATDVVSVRRAGGALTAIVATTDPAGRRLEVRITPAGDGAIALRAKVAAGADDSDVDATRIGFASPSSERFFGFGERSGVLDERGHDVENYVSDATYYPVPWLLSSRGYGVLIDRDERSTFHLATATKDAWSVEVQSHGMALRVFAGPAPAQALRRFTGATGRQPPPAQPWEYGPWFQTGQADTVPLDAEASYVDQLRRADAPVSAAETQLGYLPCGMDRGNEAYEAARVRFLHDHGLAVLTYVNPTLCASYQPLFDDAVRAGALQTDAAGAPDTFGTTEPVAQFDFTSESGLALYGSILKRLVAAGHDGWIEDAGEDTPADANSAAGTSPTVIHNEYPTTYHCGVESILAGRAVVRLQRSGWTRTARCSQDVGGSLPATTVGFDGLSSAVREALSIGMSGVSRWGSDIVGSDTELLQRWIEFGAVSAVMRARAPVFDPAVVKVWRRYAKLHTQLYPYLRAADAEYRSTGMPLMRAPALTEPGAPANDDEFGFGPDLFAAPVITAGQTSRPVRLPRGRWLAGLAYRGQDGAWVARRGRLLHGGRIVRVHAAVDELPLFVREGALLPLLSPDVATLSSRGSGVVHLGDRAGELRLLAFPHGQSEARIYDRESVRSHLTARAWTLTLSQSRTRTLDIEAVLPWRACGPHVRNGAITRIRVRMRSGTVHVQRCG